MQFEVEAIIQTYTEPLSYQLPEEEQKSLRGLHFTFNFHFQSLSVSLWRCAGRSGLLSESRGAVQAGRGLGHRGGHAHEDGGHLPQAE